jgi:DNA-binding transcriptional ArsR family regulator
MVTNELLSDRVMDALGHQTRRDILILLKAGALPVGDIAANFPVSRPAISKHLRILEQAGLVEHMPRGTRNIFRIRAVGFDVARAYVSSFWDEALANFQRIAEEQTSHEQ